MEKAASGRRPEESVDALLCEARNELGGPPGVRFAN
jgi:hypothetical protein